MGGNSSPGASRPKVTRYFTWLTIRVNPNTVARAYRDLELAGVVAKRRTAGTYVSGAGSPLARRERLKILTERIDALLAEARQLGVSTEEVIDLLRRRDEVMQPEAQED
jgi:GntR family transcriptional regulator